jgi:hypothetical protein
MTAPTRPMAPAALTNFKSSLVGAANGIALYHDFRGQIEKLAAIYVFQNGMKAEDAAKRATADVLDFKYDYRDDGKSLSLTWQQLGDLAKGQGLSHGLEQYGTALP